jgi:hypothetical protein
LKSLIPGRRSPQPRATTPKHIPPRHPDRLRRVRAGLGYVGFAEEVRQQEKALGFAFDYIVVCTVTGSTDARMRVARLKPLTSRGWLPLARQFLGLSNLCGGHASCKLVSFFYRTFHAPRGR